MAERRRLSRREVSLAKMFLRAVGANANDGSLVLAIAAWVHVNWRGYSNIRGHNPFMTRIAWQGQGRYGAGTFKYKGQAYVKYRSLGDAVRHAAFIFRSSHKYSYLRDLTMGLRALRRGGGSGAVDFLTALALSGWSVTHFGLGWQDLQRNAATTVNPLLRAYSRSTYVLPPTVQPAPKPSRPMPKPKPPRALVNDIPKRDYIQPYQALRWYEARVKEAQPMAPEVY